jgi:hypothetical protein
METRINSDDERADTFVPYNHGGPTTKKGTVDQELM